MSKYLYFLVFFVLFVSAPVFADQQSIMDSCNNEAQDNGIEDKEELRLYVMECMEQMTEENADSSASATEQPILESANAE